MSRVIQVSVDAILAVITLLKFIKEYAREKQAERGQKKKPE